MPLGDWFRGNLRELFADTLLSPREPASAATFQPAFVRRLVDEHCRGKRDHTLRLWQLRRVRAVAQQYVDARHGNASSTARTGGSAQHVAAVRWRTLAAFPERRVAPALLRLAACSDPPRIPIAVRA